MRPSKVTRDTPPAAVEQLVRDAAAHAVVHQDAEIHPLLAAAQVQPLQGHLRPFAHQVDGDIDVAGLPGKHHERQFELLPRPTT